MNHMRTIFILFLVFFSSLSFAQQKYTISGKVKDAANGEDMIGAVIFVKEINNGVVTNEYGFYSITLPEGKYTVKISYLGYLVNEQTIELNSNIKLDAELQLEASQMQAVEVIGEGERNVK